MFAFVHILYQLKIVSHRDFFSLNNVLCLLSKHFLDKVAFVHLPHGHAILLVKYTPVLIQEVPKRGEMGQKLYVRF